MHLYLIDIPRYTVHIYYPHPTPHPRLHTINLRNLSNLGSNIEASPRRPPTVASCSCILLLLTPLSPSIIIESDNSTHASAYPVTYTLSSLLKAVTILRLPVAGLREPLKFSSTINPISASTTHPTALLLASPLSQSPEHTRYFSQNQSRAWSISQDSTKDPAVPHHQSSRGRSDDDCILYDPRTT